ncbi:MAG: hypothetical protein EBV03_03830 [Proteobacteria bacterium]|nr:hypothetical protein [Pseudomonadota bacterium]
MNEDQYQALCKACDELLKATDSTVERVATPWLHVIRAHPIFLESYAKIFAPKALRSGWHRARNIASALRRLSKAFAVGGQPWISVGELPQKCDVLMVSHLVSESFPGQEGDFYYGKAAGELKAQGLSTTIALINYTEATPATLVRSWRQAKIPRVILAPVLSLGEEWSLYWRSCAEARRLKSAAAAQSNGLSRRVTARAALEAASGGAVSALRVGEQIKALVARLQPRAIVVTYEGHSWERVAFAAARAVLPQIRCIGYQHAALFNLQHAVQRRLTDNYNPDVILTSGRVSQARLQRNTQLQGVRLDTLGSNRSFARQPARAGRTSSEENRTCLVLPEGIVSECNLLFGFSLKCARAMPSTEFIWRLHPNMNYAALIRQNPAFRDLPSNITLSMDTLSEDIARSYWALYRGSTAIVQAAVSGVRPVYLHQVGEIPIDTLYEIAELHAQVAEPEDFKRLVMAVGDADTEMEQVQDYCEQMFTPMDTRVLAACIRDSIM